MYCLYYHIIPFITLTTSLYNEHFEISTNTLRKSVIVHEYYYLFLIIIIHNSFPYWHSCIKHWPQWLYQSLITSTTVHNINHHIVNIGPSMLMDTSSLPLFSLERSSQAMMSQSMGMSGMNMAPLPFSASTNALMFSQGTAGILEANNLWCTWS